MRPFVRLMWTDNCKDCECASGTILLSDIERDGGMYSVVRKGLLAFAILALLSDGLAQETGAPPTSSSGSDPALFSDRLAQETSVPPTPSSEPGPVKAQPQPQPDVDTPRSDPRTFDDVVDRIVEREHMILTQMREFRPIVETYVQVLKSDSSGNASPVNDQYFLGRLDMNDGPEGISFVGQRESGKNRLRKLTGIFSLHFELLGFAQMVVPDTDFDKTNYTFNFVRREFLGEVRCIVVDVQPKPGAPAGRFQGRIWAEDRDYSIVRFNGTFSQVPNSSAVLHFDSWRLNLKNGMWLPAYIYSEESGSDAGAGRTRLKAQTRLWGYDLKDLGRNRNDEFTQIVAEHPVDDQTDNSDDATPVASARMWERQAEEKCDRAPGESRPAGPVRWRRQGVEDRSEQSSSHQQARSPV
jgi:hypothetical protein